MNQNGYVDLDNPDTPEDESELIQENHYYPFGMDQLGNWVATVGPKNDYLYNGKEWHEDIGWYDYGARWYDPAIGRWNAVDPLAEKYAAWSPYNYVMGNPIRFIDPDGMAPDDIVYFSAAGKEIHRIKSKTINKTYVAKSASASTGTAKAVASYGSLVQSKFFDEAPMPNIIQNRTEGGTETTGAAYQKHDYEIAAQT